MFRLNTARALSSKSFLQSASPVRRSTAARRVHFGGYQYAFLVGGFLGLPAACLVLTARSTERPAAAMPLKRNAPERKNNRNFGCEVPIAPAARTFNRCALFQSFRRYELGPAQSYRCAVYQELGKNFLNKERKSQLDCVAVERRRLLEHC